MAQQEHHVHHDDKDPVDHAGFGQHLHGHQLQPLPSADVHMVESDQWALHRNLKGRHMQMIAVGGAIGSGLFIGTAGAFQAGGPGAVLVGFILVGAVIYLMMQALAELTVMYPINGAFTMYIVRFIDPSWGFACGWGYGIGWLTVLPFEISAACNIIHYWSDIDNVNNAAWIVPLLFALLVIQIFGVRGYGEVEFFLSILKIVACTGFILFGIVDICGGVSTDDRGYIGARYWHNPGAFVNGFQGFCSVFVNASFAYNGTELTGLAAAEADNPRREIPRAVKQVVFRIAFFYILTLFLVGLMVPATTTLYNDPGAESRHSPFVIAIELAGVKALPSIFNAVILIAVMSVANACTYGSTRTIQALAQAGMAPKIMAYVDKHGRPLTLVVIQLLFGLLAFINLAPTGGQIFNWLLALSGLSSFFIFGSIAVAHIRFRLAWKANGHTLDEIPYKSSCGVIGSYICAVMNFVFVMAAFYAALWPEGGPYLNAQYFFQQFLAGPFTLFLYVLWKTYSWFMVKEHRPLYTKIRNIDVHSGMREDLAGMAAEGNQEKKHGAMARGRSIVEALI